MAELTLAEARKLVLAAQRLEAAELANIPGAPPTGEMRAYVIDSLYDCLVILRDSSERIRRYRQFAKQREPAKIQSQIRALAKKLGLQVEEERADG